MVSSFVAALVIGISLGGIAFILVNGVESEPTPIQQDPEIIIKQMVLGYDECVREYGFLDEQIVNCYKSVREYYGYP